MTFDREQTNFPTQVHRNIHAAAMQLTPEDRALGWMGDAAMKSACQQLRAFMLEMLTDTVDTPEAWGLPAGQLEQFMDGRTLNGMIRRQPARAKRLYSHAYNVAYGYMQPLATLGLYGKPQGELLAISPQVVDVIFEKAKTTNSPIPAATRRAHCDAWALSKRRRGSPARRTPACSLRCAPFRAPVRPASATTSRPLAAWSSAG